MIIVSVVCIYVSQSFILVLYFSCSPTEAAFCVAQKISSNCDKTCLLMVLCTSNSHTIVIAEVIFTCSCYTHMTSSFPLD